MYLRVLCFQSFLPVPRPAPLGEVVHCGELDEGREDKGVAHCDEPVHGCSISHFRQRVSSANTESGHGQDCGHTWWCRKHSVLLTTQTTPLIVTRLWFLNSPNTVRAGTDSRLSQKETWDRMTVMKQGMYVWMTKYPIFLFR